MSDGMEELKVRLVAGRKRDGRAVYDEQAKSELVAASRMPGASVSRLARECGINANQLSRWIREDGERAQRALAGPAEAGGPVFVPVAVQAAHPVRANAVMDVQARLPNGIVIDLRGCDPTRAVPWIEALGRVRCSASTNG